MSEENCPHRWMHGVMPCEKCGNNDRGDNNVEALRHELDAWRTLGFALCGPPITCDQDMRDGINEQHVSLCRKLTASTARASELESALDSQHRLNLDFVAQNNVLIRRNQHLGESLTELVAKRDAELAAMARECEAWRKLAEWERKGARSVVWENLATSPWVTTLDENDEAFGASDETVQGAAISLAIDLGLIAPDGKGETNG